MRNSDIAELLARAGEHAKPPLQRALRRAARRAFLWPEEAEEIHARGESLTLLSGIGPYLNKQIIDWLRHPPEPEGTIPEIRHDFLTLAEARTLRSKHPDPFSEIRGDLQMHTLWSDGSGSIQDMAEAAVSRGYSYIAITDHSKGLKIAGGIDEEQLTKQAEEIDSVNEGLRGNADKPGGSAFYIGLNGTVAGLWSNCDYPTTGRGIHVCSPVVSSNSTVNFNAASHSFGSLRKLELWVDGKKLAEQYNTWQGNAWFNFSSTLAPGGHQGDIFAADVDNTLQLAAFSFTVPSSCAAPTSAGVHICAPANGSATSAPPVLVQATSTVTGTLARMEVWLDSTPPRSTPRPTPTRSPLPSG